MKIQVLSQTIITPLCKDKSKESNANSNCIALEKANEIRRLRRLQRIHESEYYLQLCLFSLSLYFQIVIMELGWLVYQVPT